MDLLDKSILIVLIVAVIFAPTIRNELTGPNRSTELGNLQTIAQNTAGTNTDTDQLNNLLTLARFDQENFAQETTLSDLAGTDFAKETTVQELLDNFTSEDFATETTLSEIDSNTENTASKISNINKIHGDTGSSTDSFDRAISLGTTSEADLGANYDFSPERWRVDLDGTRQNIQYGDLPNKYEDTIDGHLLKPGQTETMTIRTAERFRYIVGYTVVPSFAYQLNRTLETGDKVAIGYGDADLENDMARADGWFYIYTPDMAVDEVKIVEYRNGTEVAAKTVTLNKNITTWTRKAIDLNWYNVGNSKFIETYTDNGTQYNPVVGKTSVDNGKGPLTGNQRISFEVKRGDSSSPITLEAGSVGLTTNGDVDGITRTKIDDIEFTVDNSGTWEPVAAIRREPDDNLVNTQLTSTQIMEYSADTDIKMIAFSCDPGLTDASGFSTPEEFTDQNNAIEVTTSISTFPDSTGSEVSTTADPGCFQVGYTSLYTSGQGSKTEFSTSDRTEKRIIQENDVVVFAAYAGSTGSGTLEYVTEQDR